ncbi:MAG: M3 family oligoendopeptidase [Oscillospiraceae bacterium]|jgi:M3 family oligoendopeptidase|nr:M3 family oligoendopeptidase [Oscillospiraceae bacterium]
MKFSQMPYSRPDYDATEAELRSLLAEFESSRTAGEAAAAYLAIDRAGERFSTAYSLAYIRHTLDTRDKFYAAEQEYFDEVNPRLQEVTQEITAALLASPFRAELTDAWGDVMFRNAEITLKTFTPEIIGDLQEENRLTTEYGKLLASAQIEFDGKTLTLAQLAPYYQNTDRAIRKAAFQARSDWFLPHAERLDSLFDELVQLRTSMARKLGYENYIELGYYNMTRNCYDSSDIAKLRDAIVKYAVPISETLKKAQAERLGIDKVTLYDDALIFPEGNAAPKGSPDEIFAGGKQMYHDLSDDTAGFIDFMLENELFDVLTRPGKSGGGYCATIEEYKAPFIFANFNGTADDIDVLTHEAGHAFAAYLARDIEPSNLRNPTYETAEVHSMSMEFFTWPYMKLFFENPDKYRYQHLASALTFLPYGTMVDEFQHIVYGSPSLTPKERNEVWKNLESKYRPYLDYDFTFFGEGRRWQAQAHIYERPFYYIDYVLAQTAALEFWALDQTDHKAAWEKYRTFTDKAGTRTFTELIAAAGLDSPFDGDALKAIAETAHEFIINNSYQISNIR